MVRRAQAEMIAAGFQVDDVRVGAEVDKVLGGSNGGCWAESGHINECFERDDWHNERVGGIIHSSEAGREVIERLTKVAHALEDVQSFDISVSFLFNSGKLWCGNNSDSFVVDSDLIAASVKNVFEVSNIGEVVLKRVNESDSGGVGIHGVLWAGE